MSSRGNDPIDGTRARLMRAAVELIAQTGGIDATVQEVASLAGVSKKTFYQHFADKDSFFYEFWTERLDNVAKSLAARLADEPDPLTRIRAFIGALYAPEAIPAARGASKYHSRLAETAPLMIAPALRPLFELLVTLISEAQSAGQLAPRDPRDAAGPVLELAVTAARAHLDGSAVVPSPIGPDDVFEFCVRALSVGAPVGDRQ